MNTKGIFVTIFVMLCIKFGQGLQCYRHDLCHSNCPELPKTVVNCPKEDSQCWKFSSPAGVQRACGATRCGLQVDISAINTASVCCPKDLCNSSIQVKTTTISVVFMSLIAFLYKQYFE